MIFVNLSRVSKYQVWLITLLFMYVVCLLFYAIGGCCYFICYFLLFSVLERGRYLSNFACLQLRLKEGEDISGTLVIKVERFVSAVILNHTSAPPFLWQYSAISLTIDEKDCVCT